MSKRSMITRSVICLLLAVSILCAGLYALGATGRKWSEDRASYERFSADVHETLAPLGWYDGPEVKRNVLALALAVPVVFCLWLFGRGAVDVIFAV